MFLLEQGASSAMCTPTCTTKGTGVRGADGHGERSTKSPPHAGSGGSVGKEMDPNPQILLEVGIRAG